MIQLALFALGAWVLWQLALGALVLIAKVIDWWDARHGRLP